MNFFKYSRRLDDDDDDNDVQQTLWISRSDKYKIQCFHNNLNHSSEREKERKKIGNEVKIFLEAQ